MITLSDIQNQTVAFDAYMKMLDARLRDRGIHPRSRITVATIEMGRDGLVLPLFSKTGQEWSIINDWFKARHGGKLDRKDASRSYVDLICGEPFVVNVPVSFGSKKIQVNQHIEDMTVHFWLEVAQDERERILERFYRYGQCLDDADLHRADAQAHLLYAVLKLVNEPTHYGLAKWESQMLAEKTLKTFIRSHGQEPPTKGPDAHSLSKLAELAGKNGLKADLSHLVPLIECKAGVRYREIPVSLEEAVKAHQASIELAALVSREMPGEEFS